jgi:hemoglobin
VHKGIEMKPSGKQIDVSSKNIFEIHLLWFIVFSMQAVKLQQSLYERMGGRDGLMRLLWHFYSDVRQHALLGPIFNKQISDWPAHIEKITSFWARLAGGPSSYSGQMPLKHLNLGIAPHHFNVWLQLWSFNCSNHLGKTEAQEMICLAQEIGRRLKSIVCREFSLERVF